MNNPDKPSVLKRLNHLRLAIGAWFNSFFYNFVSSSTEIVESVDRFFRRFKVKGLKRLFVEIFDEGISLTLVGLLALLAFAIPAIEPTKGHWRNQGEYSVTFLDRNGTVIGQRGIRQEESVDLDELPDHFIKAVLATEDRRFFEHFGIDFFGLIRASAENLRASSVVQGGSTITQQLAKNLFLNNDRTLERKVNEAFLSLWLEANVSKNEILKLYIDRAYMGGGNFGVSAAAKYYFEKDIKDV